MRRVKGRMGWPRAAQGERQRKRSLDWRVVVFVLLVVFWGLGVLKLRRPLRMQPQAQRGVLMRVPMVRQMQRRQNQRSQQIQKQREGATALT